MDLKNCKFENVPKSASVGSLDLHQNLWVTRLGDCVEDCHLYLLSKLLTLQVPIVFVLALFRRISKFGLLVKLWRQQLNHHVLLGTIRSVVEFLFSHDFRNSNFHFRFTNRNLRRKFSILATRKSVAKSSEIPCEEARKSLPPQSKA